MLSINTNLSSLIAQNSLKDSTNILNQAIERMTTGYKINHAKDNAANYSIATNMTTKIGAYQVAEDNVLQGLDMINTASENLSLIEDKLQRLRALATQASNGTYGDKSLSAINAEANALVDELGRTYTTAEYNGLKVFKGTAKLEIPDGVGTTGDVGVQPVATYSLRAANYGNFIDNPYNYSDEDIATMKTITQAISESSLVSGGEYSISTKDELVALADYVNAGNDTTGMTFVLGADIDLSSISNWTPIGYYNSSTDNNAFKGTFDGNGHVLKDITINNGSKNYQGLFGRTASGSEIKNIGLVGGCVKGKDSVGGLVGECYSSITNCYATCDVIGTGNNAGGLVGSSYSSITNSYATGPVSGGNSVGGLVGYGNTITNSYATGPVNGGSSVGGLVGYGITITNSYATGSAKGSVRVGGVVGQANSVTNSYSTGNAIGTDRVGGLAGHTDSIINSYATGDVTGNDRVGGVVGSTMVISSSYATGDVTGNDRVGGVVGSTMVISSSYATGDVTGNDRVGGLAGQNASSSTNNYATGNVTGNKYVGGLVGFADASISNSYATGNITGIEGVGGFAGGADSPISSSYAIGNVSGNNFVGGLVGQLSKTSGSMDITNCYSYSIVSGTDADSSGGLIGGAVVTSDNTTFGTINLNGCKTYSQNCGVLGGSYMYDSTTYTLLDTYDTSSMVSAVSLYVPEITSVTLQVGTSAPSSNQITFDMAFMLDGFNSLSQIGIDTTTDFVKTADDLLAIVSAKQTEYGAIQNRLESALDEISTQYENLVSSRSTIRDADIAEVSSDYIRQQILQQASATLMATANQSPSIALQLI